MADTDSPNPSPCIGLGGRSPGSPMKDEDSLVAAAAEAEQRFEEKTEEQHEDESHSSSNGDQDDKNGNSSKEEEDYNDKDEAEEDEDEDEARSSENDSEREERLSRKPKSNKLSREDLEAMSGYLRKSGRQRKEVARFGVGNGEDEEKGRSGRRGRIRISRSSSGGSSERDSDDSEWRRQAKKRSTRRRRGKIGSSDEEDWTDSSDERRRPSRGRKKEKKVDYKEASSDEPVDSDDVLEWEGEAGTSQDAEEEAETIEKILKHRIGRYGATGASTILYNIEEKGDPNEGFDPATEKGQTQYLIKWLKWSHLHNSWDSEDDLRLRKVKGLKKLENYMVKAREMDEWRSAADKDAVEYFNCEKEMAEELLEQYISVERVIADSVIEEREGGTMEYLVKWQGLPYSESTWEDEALISKRASEQIEEYKERCKSQRIPTKLSRVLRQRPKFKPLKEQPDYVGSNQDLKLRDYQLDGLNWLLQAWCKLNGCILADEMGLGKTIQTISFISTLFHEHELYGPFLIVVPLSTLAAWQREFYQWDPDINIIVYLGDIRSREMIRQHEWYVPKTRRLKFNCCLTTYEILLKDKVFLGALDWALLAVDEAHRLKNDESLLYRSLAEFRTDHRVLITGTPLQNSMKELWALLHFIMPVLFPEWEDFEERHKSAEKMAYQSLHQELEPFILRRMKKDVEKSLPSKVEQILRVDMTALQKQYYKWILTKNYQALSKGVKGSISGFLNICMELKKCSNHAFLTRNPEDEPNDAQQRLQNLKKASGKLILLDKLLTQLFETGHRVLIFSQMVMMLDILQEYLQLKRFNYQRLDGTMRGDVRRQALDHFNQDGSTDFCFLLSTKAGGLGINLATADTVIIFDSDWNPQNDLQAQSRAHRIGQKRQVNIYRFVTKGTVEEDIVERAKQKLVLDHLVIQRMDTTGRTVLSHNNVDSKSAVPFNKQELANILKFGAAELFKEEEGEEQEPEVNIEEILQKAETREPDIQDDKADDFLKAFKVTNFTYDEKTEVGPEKTWDDIIPAAEREKIKQEEEAVVFQPLGPRARKKFQENSDEDDDWAASKRKKRGDDPNSSDSEEEEKRKTAKRAKTAVFNFSDNEVKRFVKSFRKFAMVLKRLEAIAGDADLEERSMAELKQLAEALISAYTRAAVQYEKNKSETGAGGKKDKGPVFKFGRLELNVRSLLKMQLDLEPLYLIMPEGSEGRKHFKLDVVPKEVKSWDIAWSTENDAALLRGVYEYGIGSWEAIKMDPELLLEDKILVTDKSKKPQGKHLQQRVDYLLKLIRKRHPPSDEGSSGLCIDPAVRALFSTEKGIKKPFARRAAPTPKPEKPSETKTSEPKRRPNRTRKQKSPEPEEPHRKRTKAEEDKKSSDKPVKPVVLKDNMDVKEKYEKDMAQKDGPVFKRCVSDMKKVQKAIKRMAQPDAPHDFNQSLLKIGDHIQECLAEDFLKGRSKEKWHSYYWLFVAKFFENLNGPKLCQFYRNMKAKQTDKGSKRDETEPDKNKNHVHHHHHHHHHHKHHQSSTSSKVASHNEGVLFDINQSDSGKTSSNSEVDLFDQSENFSKKSENTAERSEKAEKTQAWERSRYEEPRYLKHSKERGYNQAPNSRFGHGEDEWRKKKAHSRYVP